MAAGFVLLGIALVMGAAGLALLWWSRRLYRIAGLPTGRLVYTDTDGWQRPQAPLISRRWGLVGKPDYLIRQGRELIPVEVKTGRAPSRPYPAHILQLAAYCLLVEDWTGRRPRRGLLRYDDATFEIPFDRALRREVLRTIEQMRRAARRPSVARSHDEPARCRGCGVQYACDQRLSPPDDVPDPVPRG